MTTRWTKEENEILDRSYPLWGMRGVQSLLPHRSAESIKQAAHDRGLKVTYRRPWTEEESAIVLANYPKLGGKGTAALLNNRSSQDVAVHANARGVYRFREVA